MYLISLIVIMASSLYGMEKSENIDLQRKRSAEEYESEVKKRRLEGDKATINELFEHNNFARFFELLGQADDSSKRELLDYEFRDWKAIHWAAFHNNAAAIRELKIKGADLQAKNGSGSGISAAFNIGGYKYIGLTAIDIAVRYARAEALASLIECGIAIDEATIRNAFRDGNCEGFKCLKAVGVDLNAQDEDGSTAVHEAAERDHYEALRWLTNNGADLNARNRWNETAVHKAAEGGHCEVLKWLIDNGADLNARDDKGRTAVYIAAKWHQFEVLKLLLENGADLKARNNRGKTAVHVAAKYQAYEALVYLKSVNADILATDNEGSTAVHYAVSGRKHPMEGVLHNLQCLKELGVPFEAKNNNGNTAVHLAAGRGNYVALQCLVRLGASIDVSNNLGQTPLHLAVEKGLLPIICLLCDQGANMFVKDNQSRMPFSYNRDPRVGLFLSQFTRMLDVLSPNVRRFKGQTLLMESARSGFAKIVNALLEKGDTEVNCVDSDGNTALHLASQAGHADVVALLLKDKRTERYKENNEGNNALHLAVSNLKSHVVKVFLVLDAFNEHKRSLNAQRLHAGELAQDVFAVQSRSGNVEGIKSAQEVLKHFVNAMRISSAQEALVVRGMPLELCASLRRFAFAAFDKEK